MTRVMTPVIDVVCLSVAFLEKIVVNLSARVQNSVWSDSFVFTAVAFFYQAQTNKG